MCDCKNGGWFDFRNVCINCGGGKPPAVKFYVSLLEGDMKEVVLIILLVFSNGDTRHKEYPLDSIEQCIEVLKHTKVALPHSDNGHEGMAVVSCGYRYKGNED